MAEEHIWFLHENENCYPLMGSSESKRVSVGGNVYRKGRLCGKGAFGKVGLVNRTLRSAGLHSKM
jgi:hypothetical protein